MHTPPTCSPAPCREGRPARAPRPRPLPVSPPTAPSHSCRAVGSGCGSQPGTGSPVGVVLRPRPSPHSPPSERCAPKGPDWGSGEPRDRALLPPAPQKRQAWLRGTGALALLLLAPAEAHPMTNPTSTPGTPSARGARSERAPPADAGAGSPSPAPKAPALPSPSPCPAPGDPPPATQPLAALPQAPRSLFPLRVPAGGHSLPALAEHSTAPRRAALPARRGALSSLGVAEGLCRMSQHPVSPLTPFPAPSSSH